MTPEFWLHCYIAYRRAGYPDSRGMRGTGQVTICKLAFLINLRHDIQRYYAENGR